MSINKEKDLLYAVLEAQKVVDKIEEEIAQFQPSLSKAREVQESAEKKLVDFMDDSGKDTFRSTDFNVTVNIRSDFYASFDKENKDDAIQWIEEDCGQFELIKRKPSVHPRTLSSFLQRRMKAAEPIPGHFFKMYWKKILKIKKLS